MIFACDVYIAIIIVYSHFFPFIHVHVLTCLSEFTSCVCVNGSCIPHNTPDDDMWMSGFTSLNILYLLVICITLTFWYNIVAFPAFICMFVLSHLNMYHVRLCISYIPHIYSMVRWYPPHSPSAIYILRYPQSSLRFLIIYNPRVPSQNVTPAKHISIILLVRGSAPYIPRAYTLWSRVMLC